MLKPAEIVEALLTKNNNKIMKILRQAPKFTLETLKDPQMLVKFRIFPTEI